ncbi:MAG TPA: glycosyltransferase [Verrucomicrobiae bacterium]|nr:glycosyltransferase [Verrucomicrobiae bacterium]
MSNPYVSVLIDTYNHERFIERAITSVLEQDMPMDGVEILVVDDGSADRTPEIARRFEPRVRLLQKSNGGQASAFNAGIPECHGEIVAFLDGDDWWAPQKLRRVLEAMKQDPEAGIIGNGITEVLENGDEHSEVLHETPRFRINSLQGAQIFRRRKSQLGTSRMTVRADILRKILPVPESIVIEADEYIFTLAAALSVALILGEPLTFYRIHAGNLFQLSEFNKESILRKQKSIEILAQALSERLSRLGLAKNAIHAVVEAVQLEADLLRLQVKGGFPWETVRAEWKFYRIVHQDGSVSHMIFKLASLVPALFCPPRLYYNVRRRFGANKFYLRARKIFFPVPEPQHVTRSRRYSS